MKKILFGMLVLASVASCKKDKNDNNCETSVAGIAANYKITKAVMSFSGIPDQDQTTSIYDDCQRNGVYQLKADKTVVYTESGACTGTGNGNWDVVDNKLTLSGGSVSFTSTPLSSWDCTNLVVAQDFGGGFTLKTFFTKQ